MKRAELDKKLDTILNGSQAMVFQVKGHVAPWKWPFYCDFDMKVDKAQFTYIINQLEAVGALVYSSTCDAHGSNRSLATALGINDHNFSFENPFDPERQIWWNYDFVHMFKLLR